MIEDKNRFSYYDFFVIIFCIAVILISFVLNTIENRGVFVQFMTNQFGRTNRWSGTYGPEWLITIADEISSLGSRTIVFLEISFFITYFYITKYNEKLREFVISAIGGLLLILVLKIIFSENYSQTSLLHTDGLIFPSGHAMMAVIMYYKIPSLIFLFGFKNYGNIFIITSVIFLALLVGVSRLIVGAHTPFEVIAGFAGGVLWTYISEKYFK